MNTQTLSGHASKLRSLSGKTAGSIVVLVVSLAITMWVYLSQEITMGYTLHFAYIPVGTLILFVSFRIWFTEKNSPSLAGEFFSRLFISLFCLAAWGIATIVALSSAGLPAAHTRALVKSILPWLV